MKLGIKFILAVLLTVAPVLAFAQTNSPAPPSLNGLPNGTLAEVAGLTSGGALSVATVYQVPCERSDISPPVSPAINYSYLTNTFGCSAYIGITDTQLNVLSPAVINLPDGGVYSPGGLFTGSQVTITASCSGSFDTCGASLTAVANSPGALPAIFQSNGTAAGTYGGLTVTNGLGTYANGVTLNYVYASPASGTNGFCFSFNGNNGTCGGQIFYASGLSVLNNLQLTQTGGASAVNLGFIGSDSETGFYVPFGGTHALGMSVNGAEVWDFGQTSAGNFSFKVPVGLQGYTVSTLPTGVKGQLAFVTDAVVCTYGGALTGSSTTYCKVQYNGASWVGG